MAGLRIVGDFSNISEPQLEFIRDVLGKRGYNDNKVVFEPIGKVGDNYAADVKRIIVEDNNGGTFKMVAKFAPNLEIARIQANTKILFQNEHIMYTKVLPKFNELQKQVGIPKEERLRYAVCYGSYEEVHKGRFINDGDMSGDLVQVRERQLDFISEVLEKQGFKGPDATIINVGAAGDNYIANVKRIVVNENGKTFKMVAKLAPDNDLMRQMAQIDMLFKNEQAAYTKILPKFVQLQKSAGIPEEELFRYAKCYGSLDEAPHEVILLEDLKEAQYDILDRFKSLSIDTVKLALKNLAIYHSLSYVLKHQEPETYKEMKSNLADVFSGPTLEKMGKMMEQMETTTLSFVNDDKHKKYIKGSIGNIVTLQKKLEKANEGSKHMVIQQGDGWTNNIMFKCKDGVPVSSIMIDYQLVKENSPAYDIMYMMFNGTDHEQRQKHYYEFIDYYHEELDKSLNNFGLKANLVYPRDQLDSDLRRYGKFMLAICIMISSVLIRKSDDAAKMKEAMDTVTLDNTEQVMASTMVLDQESIMLYKSKVEGLVDSFLEFGIL